MIKISDELLDGLVVKGNKVNAALSDKVAVDRRYLAIGFGRERIEVPNLWSYYKTLSADELTEQVDCDTLEAKMFAKSQPMIGWFNGEKVIFIHPDNTSGDTLIVWCVDTDEVEWFMYKDDLGYPEIFTSQRWASKFGLQSIETYRHIRSKD